VVSARVIEDCAAWLAAKWRRPQRREKIPIMSPADEKFMAFEGLVQWTAAVIAQADRLRNAQISKRGISSRERRAAIHDLHCQVHYFVIAAWKLLEHRKWIKAFKLCKNVDFSEIDAFSKNDIRDLRNMREHVVDYFQGIGKVKDRWLKETPSYKADASSMAGTMIGGRLDWKAFSAAAAKLLPQLLNEPIPYPRTDRGPRGLRNRETGRR
jgi:hypothetical protein